MTVYASCPHCCHHQAIHLDADADDNDGSADATCRECNTDYVAEWADDGVTTRLAGLAPWPDPNQQALPL